MLKRWLIMAAGLLLCSSLAAHDISWNTCSEFLDWSNEHWSIEGHEGKQHIFVCTVEGAGYTPTSWTACTSTFSNSGVVNVRCGWWGTRRKLCGNPPPSYCQDPGPPENPTLIFEDDFESGDTSKWSSVVGEENG